VTAKEKLLERAAGWSEEQAARAIRAAEGAPGDTVDDWGNLSVLHEQSFEETMRRLCEQERAAGREPW
jgi:hypothetical protein